MSFKLIPYTLGVVTVLGLSCATSQQVSDNKHCFEPPPRKTGEQFLDAEAYRMATGLGFVLTTVSEGDAAFSEEEQVHARVVRIASMQALAQLLRERLSDKDQQIADLIAQDMVQSTKDSIRKNTVDTAEPLPTP